MAPRTPRSPPPPRSAQESAWKRAGRTVAEVQFDLSGSHSRVDGQDTFEAPHRSRRLVPGALLTVMEAWAHMSLVMTQDGGITAPRPLLTLPPGGSLESTLQPLRRVIPHPPTSTRQL